WRVELEEVTVRIEEVETSSAGTVHRRNAMNLNSPVFHFLCRQLEVFRGHRKGVVGSAVFLQSVFLDRRRSLKEDDHAVSRSQDGPVQMISHVVPVELRDLHSQDLGVEFYRPFHVIDRDTDMVNACRGDHNSSFVNAFGTLSVIQCQLPPEDSASQTF